MTETFNVKNSNWKKAVTRRMGGDQLGSEHFEHDCHISMETIVCRAIRRTEKQKLRDSMRHPEED